MCASARLANLTTDASNKKTADMLDQRYSALDQEMEEIGKMWSNAKADLARYTKEQVCGCVLLLPVYTYIVVFCFVVVLLLPLCCCLLIVVCFHSLFIVVLFFPVYCCLLFIAVVFVASSLLCISVLHMHMTIGVLCDCLPVIIIILVSVVCTL